MGGVRLCDSGCRRYAQFGVANNREAYETIGFPNLCPYISPSERGGEPRYRSYGADDVDCENLIFALCLVRFPTFFRNLY